MGCLTPREKEVIFKYYILGLSLEKIGKDMENGPKCTRQMASLIKLKAVNKMRVQEETFEKLGEERLERSEKMKSLYLMEPKKSISKRKINNNI